MFCFFNANAAEVESLNSSKDVITDKVIRRQISEQTYYLLHL